MNIALTLCLLTAVCTTVLAATKWPMKDGKPCRCSRLSDPVCGSDGQDYPNPECARHCGEVRSFRRGTCAQPHKCGCQRNIKTVCAIRPDGNYDLFNNKCVAECENGATFVNDGLCQGIPVLPLPNPSVKQLRQLSRKSIESEQEKRLRCLCPASPAPDMAVCGLKNGLWIDYESECLARCAEAEHIRHENCKRPCVCYRIYSPVCARAPDGTLKDYSNDCVAECENAVIVSSGNCEAEPSYVIEYELRPTICDGNYAPVCAEKNGVIKDYDNKCYADYNNAIYIKNGKCNLKIYRPIQNRVLSDNTRDSDLVPARLPWSPDDSDDADLKPAHLPWSPDDSDDADLKPAHLPWSPDDSDDADLKPAHLPWSPDDSDDADLKPAHLPWSPDDSDDADIKSAHLPWSPDDSNDSDDSDRVASQHSVFSSLFK